jgi:hypothetical protein
MAENEQTIRLNEEKRSDKQHFRAQEKPFFDSNFFKCLVKPYFPEIASGPQFRNL